ncbi:hypothetical protein EhV206 [Emiliania huxleyi virus 86]|uniref:Putative membrane protein n=2 Tax=Emiliania huxleyi virus 86 TaxID=181082 RepID=Q4A2S7_EHV8U|nr:hypothetical protein EhV206 [Emiliania huxleyi virus 86]AEO97565.1 hypothetical protein ENVG_00479 [Emiliania huxleyi virus 84]AEP15295.1 hypothetical protein EOVG_00358 [Emiliania huxleyi virus 88]AHA54806.1 putative membrane protein [Emiliania huxleyi virus 145]AHA55827.1 putative membrane protein [Emiliania huxleyi virus 164]CAI65629.1 putative membrane protein [Emiliania huxleyi virus 86]
MEINKPVASVIMLTIIAVLFIVYSLVTSRNNDNNMQHIKNRISEHILEVDAENRVIRSKIIAMNESSIDNLKKARAKLNKSMRNKSSKGPKRPKRRKR